MINAKSILIFIFSFFIILVSSAACEMRERPLSIIYPGQGFGNVMLKSELKEVVRSLGWGEPNALRKDEMNKEYYLIYKSKGIILTLKTNGDKALGETTLYKITFLSPAFAIVGSGIKVGDNIKAISEIRAAKGSRQLPQYGEINKCPSYKYKDDSNNMIICDREGVSFLVDNNSNIIKAIEIFPPRIFYPYIRIKSLQVTESGDATNDDGEIYFKVFINGKKIEPADLPLGTGSPRPFKINDNSKKSLNYKFRIPGVELHFKKFNLRLEVWDWDRGGTVKHDLIGDFTMEFIEDKHPFFKSIEVTSKKLRRFDSRIVLELVAE